MPVSYTHLDVYKRQGEALANGQPVLLEPILAVEIAIPSEALSRATGIAAARRGQILGYDPRLGWDGWDVVHVQILSLIHI